MSDSPNGVSCKYATLTDQKWVGDIANCHVVECRSPEAMKKLHVFVINGVEYPAVRRPCDKDFNLIPDADYLHVRSRFCNAEYCPYFEQ